MIRKGKYASYHGEEYRFRVLDGNRIKLISNNPSDVNNGFTPLDQAIFTKIVNISDVDQLFFIFPHMQNIKKNCLQLLKKGELVKFCWIRQIRSWQKKWILNGRINICIPK